MPTITSGDCAMWKWKSVRWLESSRTRKLLGSRSKSRKPSRQLGVEPLEDRCVPATHVWSGAAALTGDPNWSNALNWSAGEAPAVDEVGPIDIMLPAGII